MLQLCYTKRSSNSSLVSLWTQPWITTQCSAHYSITIDLCNNVGYTAKYKIKISLCSIFFDVILKIFSLDEINISLVCTMYVCNLAVCILISSVHFTTFYFSKLFYSYSQTICRYTCMFKQSHRYSHSSEIWKWVCEYAAVTIHENNNTKIFVNSL